MLKTEKDKNPLDDFKYTKEYKEYGDYIQYNIPNLPTFMSYRHKRFYIHSNASLAILDGVNKKLICKDISKASLLEAIYIISKDEVNHNKRVSFNFKNTVIIDTVNFEVISVDGKINSDLFFETPPPKTGSFDRVLIHYTDEDGDIKLCTYLQSFGYSLAFKLFDKIEKNCYFTDVQPSRGVSDFLLNLAAANFGYDSPTITTVLESVPFYIGLLKEPSKSQKTDELKRLLKLDTLPIKSEHFNNERKMIGKAYTLLDVICGLNWEPGESLEIDYPVDENIISIVGGNSTLYVTSKGKISRKDFIDATGIENVIFIEV